MDAPDNAARPLILWERLDASGRICAAVCFLLIAGVLALAYLLQPDASGHGTHRQLGLAPCAAMQLANTPCPFCGMTTAFSHFAHGAPKTAFAVQPAGALLFIGAIGAAGLCLAAALTGRWTPGILEESRIRKALFAAALVITGAWIYKIAQVWSAPGP